jgi:hypothetical protein
MHVNRKMIPLKTVAGMEGRRVMENDRESEFNHDIFGIL